MNNNAGKDLLFQWKGIPPFADSLSLALQHLVAMIVGCVTPAIIISNALGMTGSDRIMLIQASLVFSALSTLVQLFPVGSGRFRFGSGLPIILGISFAYLPSMQAIVEAGGNVATIMAVLLNIILPPEEEA